MTLTDRVLRWLYLAAGAFTAHCASISAEAGDLRYALGLGIVTVLFVAAEVREYLAADGRRAAKVRAERVARLRDRAEQDRIRQAADALGHTCCEVWWTSCGTRHTRTCKNQRRPV
ncbi:hypothetical protein [Streptomyces sp. YKOK-I1]